MEDFKWKMRSRKLLKILTVSSYSIKLRPQPADLTIHALTCPNNLSFVSTFQGYSWKKTIIWCGIFVTQANNVLPTSPLFMNNWSSWFLGLPACWSVMLFCCGMIVLYRSNYCECFGCLAAIVTSSICCVMWRQLAPSIIVWSIWWFQTICVSNLVTENEWQIL